MPNGQSSVPPQLRQWHRNGERGVALITVLLITAILAGLTTQILSSRNLINQHQNTFEHAQALEYALGQKNWCAKHSMTMP